MVKSKSFESILESAVAGDHDALEKILEIYMPLINKHSYIDGTFDEDCKQYIMMRIAMQITKFELYP